MPKFKNNLKYYREKYGLSQEEVANKVGTVKGTVSKYERGERKINGFYLVKFAKLFNVSPEAILGEENNSTIVNSIKTKNDLRKEMMAFFKSSDISEEDKQEIFNQMQEFYFKEKLKEKKWFSNKLKNAPNFNLKQKMVLLYLFCQKMKIWGIFRRIWGIFHFNI